MDILEVLPYVLSGSSFVFAAGVWFAKDQAIKVQLSTIEKKYVAIDKHNDLINTVNMNTVELKEHRNSIAEIHIEQAKILTTLEYLKEMSDKIYHKVENKHEKDK